MATYFYQSKATKQQWLGSVMMCNECYGQKEKSSFRLFNNTEMCVDCYTEMKEEQEREGSLNAEIH